MERIDLKSDDLGPDFSKKEQCGIENYAFEASKDNIFHDEEEDVYYEYLENKPDKKYNYEKPKFYHVSDKFYDVGDVIEGESSNNQFKNVVFLTDSPRPHYSLKDRKFNNAFIYRVVPISGVKGGRFWDELASKRVRVVERAGSAKNFLNKDSFSSVKLKDFDDKKNIETSKIYRVGKGDNLEGKKLLKKIEKKYD